MICCPIIIVQLLDPMVTTLAPATYHFNSWNRTFDILVHEMGYPPQVVRYALY